jgi:hypothetical protein
MFRPDSHTDANGNCNYDGRNSHPENDPKPALPNAANHHLGNRRRRSHEVVAVVVRISTGVVRPGAQAYLLIIVIVQGRRRSFAIECELFLSCLWLLLLLLLLLLRGRFIICPRNAL